MFVKRVRNLERFFLILGLAAAILAVAMWWNGNLREALEQVVHPGALHGIHVGVVSGHWGSDSGATCPDGLEEVDVNHAVALEVQKKLEALGAKVDLLQEFSPKLQGYRADLLISIHADTCIPDRHGFKVAAAQGSAESLETRRLVACLVSRYRDATGIPFDSNTITYDMTQYHAFREIDPHTPAAIIETGFMGGDREILTKHPDVVAGGIVSGIRCFLERR